MAKPRKRSVPSAAPAPEPGAREPEVPAAAMPAEPEPVEPPPSIPERAVAEEPVAALPAPRSELPAGDEPDGPAEGRVYSAVFGRVWVAALAAVQAMSRWTAQGSDPVRGEILVEVRALLGKGTRRARVRVALDELGLTRVEAAFVNESGRRTDDGGRRQFNGFYRKLEAALRRGGR